MNNQEAQKFIDRYNQGTATPEERIWVERWYLDEAAKRKLSDEQDFEHLNEEIWKGTLNRAGLSEKGRQVNIWARITTAAVVLMTVAISVYFYNNRGKSLKNQEIQYVQDLKPGGNKAILTLGNGEKVVLADLAKGEIAKQAGISIRKTADGQLVYTMSNSKPLAANAKLIYNIIETPRGGQYQVNLPDGTRVWLNAASTLKFPTQFTANERKVELTGEGYFEVAHDKSIPFKVVTAQQEIEVLGTHFNVNAYTNEDGIKTTLLEGSVKINKSTILKPGQQSVFGGNALRISTVDTDLAVAWKNGYFMFENATLKTMMRQLSRWYDVEVKYEGEVSPVLFSGKVHRNTSLVQVLELLSFSKVNFRIEGKQIIIINKNSE